MVRETHVVATDGTKLYAWTRGPDAGSALGSDGARFGESGVIAHVHGLGEHSRRYDHVTEFWASRGYASAGFDLRGHGRSGGRRGHTSSYAQLMDDIAALLELVAARWPGLPVTLYGHSLGGSLEPHRRQLQQPEDALLDEGHVGLVRGALDRHAEQLKRVRVFHRSPGVNPMIAIYGEFGIRLEDCLYITDSGPNFFTTPSPSIDKPFA